MKTIIIGFRGRKDKLTLLGHLLFDYLKGDVLDVGCDQKHLSTFVGGRYVGVDLAGKPNVMVNLEYGLPFKDMSFETVVAFDILEHLDNIHWVFDELCRVARRFVIIGLPNMYEWHFRLMFLLGKPLSGKYGLPIDPPTDRHRWLFSLEQARAFIQKRSFRSGFKIHEEIIGYYQYRTIWAQVITAISKVLSQYSNNFSNLFAYYYLAILQRDVNDTKYL